MQLEIDSFVHRIAFIATVVMIIFFCVGIANGYNIGFNINFAIGVFVSFVPEGLPATVTVC